VRNGPSDVSYDAALAQLPILGYPNRQLGEFTVLHIARELALTRGRRILLPLRAGRRLWKTGSGLRHLLLLDRPSPCPSGRIPEARSIRDRVLVSANHAGLFSEHFIPSTNTQCGNFPQAYSHVGLINAAFAVSPPWSDVL